MDFYIDDEKCTIATKEYLCGTATMSRVICEIPKEAFIEMYEKWIEGDKE